MTIPTPPAEPAATGKISWSLPLSEIHNDTSLKVFAFNYLQNMLKVFILFVKQNGSKSISNKISHFQIVVKELNMVYLSNITVNNDTE